MIGLLLVSAFAIGSNGNTALLAAFFLGLLQDIWRGTTLGVFSIIYLSVVFIILLYKRKLRTLSLRFMIVFFSALVFFYEILVYKGLFPLVDFLLTLVCTILLVCIMYSILFAWNRIRGGNKPFGSEEVL
jgi:rod shape-determining protein MreD